MDKQQDLFTYLVVKLREEGYTVYDCGVPGPSATYPYILLSNMQQVDEITKLGAVANVYPTIDVYHDIVTQRGLVSDIMMRIKQICMEFATENNWLLSGISTQIRPDNTTAVPLLHGILEPTFQR